VHLHLVGGSPGAADPDLKGGEASKFPHYADRLACTGKHELSNLDEGGKIVARQKELLVSKYGFSAGTMEKD